MPEQDGIGVLMELRKMSSKLKTIVITGGTSKLDVLNLVQTAKVLKADRVLTKPLDFENLKLTVAELLKPSEEAS
jgi:CheY-like chemotaxis protein